MPLLYFGRVVFDGDMGHPEISFLGVTVEKTSGS